MIEEGATREVERWREREALRIEADDALEEATRDQLPLQRTMDRLLPLVAARVDAARVEVTTYDEELEMRAFWWAREGAPEQLTESVEVALDVAGESFGQATVSFDHPLDADRREHAEGMLHLWCEQLDNYLAALQQARRKHRVTGRMSDALKHPVLDQGLEEAIAVLREVIGFDDLILAFHHEDDRLGETLSFKAFRGGTLVASSARPADGDEQALLRAHAEGFITGTDDTLLEAFGLEAGQEQVLINGIKDQRVIGRLLVQRRARELNTVDRDLLQRFADYLRQRIVDFNREYKHLALCFPPPVVQRLLAEEDYVARYLRPTEQEIAILYTDIAGFTRMSERVLQSPARIGKLIDAWSEGVVDIIWERAGVFDKMVGDCIIALWGPPFYELSPAQACERAIDAAVQIRRFTRELADSPDFPELSPGDLGVSTGINHCQASVGFFGPNLDYTAFGAGMNNAARLQGLAKPDEILCMSTVVDALGDDTRFGEAREAEVKNVTRPLAFRVLDG